MAFSWVTNPKFREWFLDQMMLNAITGSQESLLDECLQGWKSRSSSLIGKVLVLNILGLSKLFSLPVFFRLHNGLIKLFSLVCRDHM